MTEEHNMNINTDIKNDISLNFASKKELNNLIKSLKDQYIKDHPKKQLSENVLKQREEIKNNFSSSPDEQIEEKKSIRGRPKNELLGIESKFNKDIYFVKYYHDKGKIEMQCENCTRFITKANISKHKKSDYCRNYIKPV